MKKLTLIGVIAAIFAACSPNQNNPTPNPTPPSQPNADLHWVPNWRNDTLCGMLMPYTGEYDTLYSYSRNDTSFINYKGVEYYIWIDSKYTPFVDNNDGYPLCYIGANPMDNSTSLTTCAARPGKWYNENYQEWRTGRQSVILTLTPPFPSNIQGSTYMSDPI